MNYNASVGNTTYGKLDKTEMQITRMSKARKTKLYIEVSCSRTSASEWSTLR